MFPEYDIDEFMYNMSGDDENFIFSGDLTDEELELQLESYKKMKEVTEQGKIVYKFDQTWLM